MSDTLENAINEFTRKREQMLAAEKALDAVVCPVLKDETDVDKLNELVDRLPQGYKGVRRVYELIIRLEDGSL